MSVGKNSGANGSEPMSASTAQGQSMGASVPSLGDTGEFLKLVGLDEQGGSDSSTGGQSSSQSSKDQNSAASRSENPKPIVIKGGPRRVVRADGQAPESTFVMEPRRFALSSGHAMFAPKKHRHTLLTTLFAILAIVAVAGVFYASWRYGQGMVQQAKQHDVVDTRGYDAALSVTPANDGGYYTVFFITSTPTNEDEIGALSEVILYRCDKGKTQAMRVHVPCDLYVAPSSSTSEARSLSQVLASQSITRALQGICDAFGLRLYNVVCCQQSVYDELASIMSGATPATSIEPDTLLGKVRTNLSLPDLLAYCGDISNIDQASIPDMTAPTTPTDVNGAIMSKGDPALYAQMISTGMTGYKLDDRGYLLGTQYDEDGNPILDENGNPVGALYDEEGRLIFDEEGYLQFWGQQYDENGNPVGTPYDEYGNPMFDWNGYPLGTQYGEDGEPLLDWRGNIIIGE